MLNIWTLLYIFSIFHLRVKKEWKSFCFTADIVFLIKYLVYSWALVLSRRLQNIVCVIEIKCFPACVWIIYIVIYLLINIDFFFTLTLKGPEFVRTKKTSNSLLVLLVLIIQVMKMKYESLLRFFIKYYKTNRNSYWTINF